MSGEKHTADFTPGPWGWFGNQHGIYLATPDRGRLFVMGFDRWGMQKAQPTFRGRDGLMRPATDLVTFAVGDKVAVGFDAARADETVYRYDISGIDNPDARLIAAAPEMFEALKPFAAMAEAGDQRPSDDAVWAGQDGNRITYGDFRRALAALAKAKFPQVEG